MSRGNFTNPKQAADNVKCFLKPVSLLFTSTVTDLTAQKKKFSITDFFSKCNYIRRKLRIWSLSLKKSLMENLIFCVVTPAKIKSKSCQKIRATVKSKHYLSYCVK